MVENKNKLEKYVFLLVTSVGQRKNSEFPLSHRDCGERGLLRSSYKMRRAYC